MTGGSAGPSGAGRPIPYAAAPGTEDAMRPRLKSVFV
jgi:hypothetical protein